MFDIFDNENYELYNINGYSTQTFSDIYPTYDDFDQGIKDSTGNTIIPGVQTIPEFTNVIKNQSNFKILYYMLLARYGNSPIANNDQYQFSLKLFSIIYQYGPTWEEKLDIQNKIRNLTDEEIKKGAKAIYNHALNPNTDPSTDSLLELDYINDQNTTNYLKSDMEAYSLKWSLLNDRVNENFLKKFQYLFLQVARPTRNIYYGTKGDDNYE